MRYHPDPIQLRTLPDWFKALVAATHARSAQQGWEQDVGASGGQGAGVEGGHGAGVPAAGRCHRARMRSGQAAAADLDGPLEGSLLVGVVKPCTHLEQLFLGKAFGVGGHVLRVARLPPGFAPG